MSIDTGTPTEWADLARRKYAEYQHLLAEDDPSKAIAVGLRERGLAQMVPHLLAAIGAVREEIAAAIEARRDGMYPANGDLPRSLARTHFTDCAEIARHGKVPSFLDFLLEGDKTGHLQAIVDADKADLAAGITWGVYRSGKLIGTHPARYMADADARDSADANDVDLSEYEVRPVGEKEQDRG